MTVIILLSNREVVHRSTYQDLLPDDLESTEQHTKWEAFVDSVSIKYGPGETVEYFDKLFAVETPKYDMYRDDTTEGACPNTPPKELEPTPDATPDHY